MNELQKKLGPLKLWQWLVIGLGTGGVVYLWKRSHEGAPAVNPEEEEKLLGALGRGGGSGGGGEGSGGSEVAAPGPVGLTGEAGAPGIAGPQGEAFNPAPIEGRLEGLEHQLAANNPAAALSHTTAPKVNPQHLTRNPANGEMYRTVKRGKATFHEYPHRKGANKFVRVGGKGHGKPTGHAQKPKPAKRPKPKPIHQRVTVHHAPAHRAAPRPVHHPKPARRRG